MSDLDPDVGCAVLHKDGEGRTVPCPGDHPMPPPELSEVDQLRADNESLRYQIERARWALGIDEPINAQLRQAEIRAAVAEHEAVAYRNQVKALVRAIQRERGLPEEALDGEVFVVAAESMPQSAETPGEGGGPAREASTLDAIYGAFGEWAERGSIRALAREALNLDPSKARALTNDELLAYACAQLQKADPGKTQRLVQAVEEALKVHRRELQDDRHEDTAVCAADGEDWPCPTVAALAKAAGGEQS